jgi:DNA-binding response OmpR family regulator
MKKGKKILIAEDDKFLHKILQTKLRKEGFEIISAFDGEQAVNKLKETLPDLILLDIVMPKKNGFEVLEEMKIMPTVAKTPVIILSNLGQDSDIAKAKEFGIKDYMVKANFSINEVIAKIKSKLGIK